MLSTQQNMPLFYAKALEIVSTGPAATHRHWVNSLCKCSLFSGENVSPLQTQILGSPEVTLRVGNGI